MYTVCLDFNIFDVFQENEYFGGCEDFRWSSLSWAILGLISIFYDIFVTLRYRLGIFFGVCLDPVYIVILGPGGGGYAKISGILGYARHA